MYLILIEGKGQIPPTWCTCEEADLRSCLLELVAAGYNENDDVYLMPLMPETTPDISGIQIRAKKVYAEIGAHPFGLMRREAQQEDSPVVLSEPAISQPKPVNPKEPEDRRPAGKEFHSNAEENVISDNNGKGFASKTESRFGYLDRVPAGTTERISEELSNTEQCDCGVIPAEKVEATAELGEEPAESDNNPALDRKTHPLKAKSENIPAKLW